MIIICWKPYFPDHYCQIVKHSNHEWGKHFYVLPQGFLCIWKIRYTLWRYHIITSRLLVYLKDQVYPVEILYYYLKASCVFERSGIPCGDIILLPQGFLCIWKMRYTLWRYYIITSRLLVYLKDQVYPVEILYYYLKASCVFKRSGIPCGDIILLPQGF